MKLKSSEKDKSAFVRSELVEYGRIEEITRQGTTVLHTPPTDTTSNYS